ncbi:MAG: type IX secretion system membrane protein PorP/SprF [Chitinophagales bacterium]|nr:type IX secretion system membrane protein PorP/SprF [Chitinophagales bacterium]
MFTINKLKSALLILFCCTVVFMVQAQQEPQYTQFMYNKLPINAGYTGARGALSLRALYRTQWVKIDGAPQTASFSIHSPLKKENSALGLFVVNDRLGVTNQTWIDASYAYRIKLSEKIKLSIGINAGLQIYKSNLSELNRADQTDEAYAQNVSRILPDVGAGLYLYHPKFYVGVSVPNFIKSTLYNKEQASLIAKDSIAQRTPHLFTMAGGVIPVTGGFKIRPQVMGKYIINKEQKIPFEMDFNLSFLIIDRINIGGTYRTAFHKKKTGLENHDSFDFNLEVWPTKQLMIGYAYDYTLSKLQDYNKGTHEIILGYDVFRKEDKIRTPRYF